MKTAEDFFNQYKYCVMLSEGGYKYLVDEDDFLVALTEFAKMHVKAALKQASNNLTDSHSSLSAWENSKQEILEAYPLENIK